ncbi:MAG: GAF domain-containing sensor histidine kinase [Anaerolineales bacterium]
MPTEAEARMRALHRATLSLYVDLSLEGVLRRTVAAAKELTEARYAALGIPDDQGGMETFITLGMTDDEMQTIPHLPQGKGLLGEMIRTGRSIRIPEISQHKKSVGFPEGHPEMHSFLGVPIAAYGWTLGQIYLTDKTSAPAFTEEDQHLIEMLAGHAAAAIGNARLYQQVLEGQAELAQRNEELELIDHLTNMVSSAMELEDLLEVILSRVKELFAADAGEVFLRELGKKDYRLVVHLGQAPEAFQEVETFRAGQGLIGKVAESGKPLSISNLAKEPGLLRQGLVEAGFGAYVSVPLGARGETVGVLSLAFLAEREVSERELSLLSAVGAAAGIAIENARLNRQSRRLAVLEERERIGMDLHDGIIQSIYAVGLTLESVRLLASDESLGPRERIDQAIDGLNAVIRELRTYILDLQPARILEEDLGQALGRLAAEFKANTGTDVDLIVEPEAVGNLERKASAELFRIAQEALANIAKHANASRAWISVRQVENEILMQVIDNGQGFDLEQEPRVLGHGLSNMAIRASTIGGTSSVVSGLGEGTTVTISLQAIKGASAKPREKGLLAAS